MTADAFLILVLVIAPLPYWLVGLPWVSSTSALRLAPAFGLGLLGWLAELGLMSGCGATGAVIAGLVLSAAILVARPPAWDDLRGTLVEGYALYLVALVPTLVSPFPVLGIWSGDWLHMYDAGQAVWTGGQFTPALLERPPLGGAITIPLWLIRDGLASYQLATAVSSAALLGAILHGYRTLGGSRSVAAALVPVAGSMYFLHHTAAAWSKPLAAALVVATVFLGLVPLEALLLVGLLVRLDAASTRIQKWVAVLTVVLAIIPFIGVNAGVSVGLRFSERFRVQFSAGSEGDWTERVLARGLEPLGLATFPLGAACIVIALLAIGWAGRSRTPAVESGC